MCVWSTKMHLKKDMLLFFRTKPGFLSLVSYFNTFKVDFILLSNILFIKIFPFIIALHFSTML